MIIYKVTVSKKQLSLFPEKERVLFIQIRSVSMKMRHFHTIFSVPPRHFPMTVC